VVFRLTRRYCYVLSLHLELETTEKRHIVITGTLGVVIFTIVILGGLTYPMITFLKMTATDSRRERKEAEAQAGWNTGLQTVTLSKTEHHSGALESDYGSSMYTGSDGSGSSQDASDIEDDPHQRLLNHDLESMPLASSAKKRRRKKPKNTERVVHGPKQDYNTLTGAFARVDAQIFTPFLCRRVTREELIANRTQMRQFASKWYDEVRKKNYQLMINRTPSVGDTVMHFINQAQGNARATTASTSPTEIRPIGAARVRVTKNFNESSFDASSERERPPRSGRRKQNGHYVSSDVDMIASTSKDTNYNSSSDSR